jgi:hypothetical protein
LIADARPVADRSSSGWHPQIRRDLIQNNEKTPPGGKSGGVSCRRCTAENGATGAYVRYLNGFLLAWLQRLAIQPPRDKKLVTLKDAVGYIIALPKSKQQAPERQAAAEALFDGGDASRAMTVASLSSSKSDLLVALRRQRPRAVVRRGPNVGRQHHE